MRPTFQPMSVHGGPDSALTGTAAQLPEDSPQLARIAPGQQLLFPPSPRSLCDEIGLHWQSAARLQEEGWLSFSIENTPQLDEAQEAELRFVGTLVLAACDRNMLRLLLAGLPRPYAYDPNRIFFDWRTRRWRMLPDPRSNPEATFTDWVETLRQNRDAASLVGIIELAQDALSRVNGCS